MSQLKSLQNMQKIKEILIYYFLEFKELISRVAFHEIYGYDKKFEDKIWKT